MNTPIVYNGYSAIIEFDSECDSFRGEVLDINDTITFYAKSVDELKAAMKEAIDDYLEHCAEIGRTPEKPYSRKISLHMTTELHKRASNAARMRGNSINSLLLSVLKNKFSGQILYL